jgi:hypothetical protein
VIGGESSVVASEGAIFMRGVAPKVEWSSKERLGSLLFVTAASGCVTSGQRGETAPHADSTRAIMTNDYQGKMTKSKVLENED